MSKPEQARSLAEAFPAEQARCRTVLGHYKEIGAPGAFGAAMIEDVLKRADAAVAEQDAVAMLRLYKEMKDCE